MIIWRERARVGICSQNEDYISSMHMLAMIMSALHTSTYSPLFIISSQSLRALVSANVYRMSTLKTKSILNCITLAASWCCTSCRWQSLSTATPSSWSPSHDTQTSCNVSEKFDQFAHTVVFRCEKPRFHTVRKKLVFACFRFRQFFFFAGDDVHDLLF